VQAQALLVGLLAALFAVILGWVPEGKFSITHALLLASSSVLTAGIASFVLGTTSFGLQYIMLSLSISKSKIAVILFCLQLY